MLNSLDFGKPKSRLFIQFSDGLPSQETLMEPQAVIQIHFLPEEAFKIM